MVIHTKKSIYLISLLFISLITFINTQAQVNLSTGLVVYFPFNGNANDASGNGFNASVSGASLTSDRFGNPNSAYLFSTSTDIITSNMQDLSQGIGSFSVSMWFNAANTSSGSTYPSLISLYDSAYFNTTETNFTIVTTIRPYVPGTLNEIWGIINDNGGSFQTNLTSNSNEFTVNTWYMTTFTYDAPTNTFKMYKNGTLHKSATAANDLKKITTLALGKQNDYPYNSGFTYYLGTLDDIRIYDRVLNDAEVSAIYNLSSSATTVDCNTFLFTKPTIIFTTNNLQANPAYQGAGYQWFVNNNIESGQITSIHTAPLLNSEYMVSVTLSGCGSISSDPISIFKSMQTTTVTVIEVVTATSCNTTNDNLRLESSPDISIDMDPNTGKLNIKDPAKSISKLEISNDQGLLLASLPQVAFVDFKDKDPGIYTVKALNAKGSILKIVRVQFE